jgi:hypothetical protein
MITPALPVKNRRGLQLIYGLYEPGASLPFYIGKGGLKRIRSHWVRYLFTKKYGNCRVQNVFEKLLGSGIEPVAKILAIYDDENSAAIAEERAINAFGTLEESGTLCNIRKGSAGASSSHMTEKVIRNMRKAQKGKVIAADTKERMSLAAKRKCSDYDSRKAWLASTQSPEAKLKRVNSYMKWWNSLIQEQQSEHKRKSGTRKNSR